MNTTTTTDDALLKLARKIASDSLLRREKWLPGVKAGIHEEIIAGHVDDEPLVVTALAAIRETSRLAAAWIESEQPSYIGRCTDPASAAANHYAGGLEQFAHLKETHSHD